MPDNTVVDEETYRIEFAGKGRTGHDRQQTIEALSRYDLALWCKKPMTGKAGLTTETVSTTMEAAEPQAEGSQKLYGLGLEYVPSLGWGRFCPVVRHVGSILVC
jgi:hypothetical protein